MSRAQSWIVAVAVRLGGKVYAGHHRHAVLMNEIWRNLGNVRINQEDQGFLTNEGIFINRFQAGALAFENGQAKVRHNTLLSEHIWPSRYESSAHGEPDCAQSR